MAISTSCCLNLTPPTPNSPSPSTASPTKTNFHTPWLKNEKWRTKCVVAMATCLVLGLEMKCWVTEDSLAMAKDMQLNNIVASKDKRRELRWSDKRECPPWHLNSLETIVPENLPRPSARRRWEAVGQDEHAPKVAAPGVAEEDVTIKNSKKNCFSM